MFYETGEDSAGIPFIRLRYVGKENIVREIRSLKIQEPANAGTINMEDIPIEKRLTLDFYYEVFCPFCRRVRINILDKLRMKSLVTINPIDVDSNFGCVEMSRYKIFCKKIESEPTPLLRMHESYSDESGWEYFFLMWKKKPTTLTEEVLSSEEFLEKQLYDKIREAQKTLFFPVQKSYELDRDVFLATIHKLKLDEIDYSYLMKPRM